MEPIDESLVSPPFESVTIKEVNQRCYRLICLDRSSFNAKKAKDITSEWFDNQDIVFWRPNFAGYTDNIDEAGIYTLQELDECPGSHLDWFACPVWPHRL